MAGRLVFARRAEQRVTVHSVLWWRLAVRRGLKFHRKRSCGVGTRLAGKQHYHTISPNVLSLDADRFLRLEPLPPDREAGRRSG